MLPTNRSVKWPTNYFYTFKVLRPLSCVGRILFRSVKELHNGIGIIFVTNGGEVLIVVEFD